MVKHAATHQLTSERDALFLQYAPRDGLWFQKFEIGDIITGCYQCRRIFYAADWREHCPICGCIYPLYTTRPNMLLATERVSNERGTVIRPLSADQLSYFFIKGGHAHGRNNENA